MGGAFKDKAETIEQRKSRTSSEMRPRDLNIQGAKVTDVNQRKSKGGRLHVKQGVGLRLWQDFSFDLRDSVTVTLF